MKGWWKENGDVVYGMFKFIAMFFVIFCAMMATLLGIFFFLLHWLLSTV